MGETLVGLGFVFFLLNLLFCRTPSPALRSLPHSVRSVCQELRAAKPVAGGNLRKREPSLTQTAISSPTCQSCSVGVFTSTESDSESSSSILIVNLRKFTHNSCYQMKTWASAHIFPLLNTIGTLQPLVSFSKFKVHLFLSILWCYVALWADTTQVVGFNWGDTKSKAQSWGVGKAVLIHTLPRWTAQPLPASCLFRCVAIELMLRKLNWVLSWALLLYCWMTASP